MQDAEWDGAWERRLEAGAVQCAVWLWRSGCPRAGAGGLMALLSGFNVLADVFGIGEPGGDADCSSDRGVSDLLALLFQGGERGEETLAFVEAVAARQASARVCGLPCGFMPGLCWRWR